MNLKYKIRFEGYQINRNDIAFYCYFPNFFPYQKYKDKNFILFVDADQMNIKKYLVSLFFLFNREELENDFIGIKILCKL
jgi:hypothetical protein